MLRSLEGEARCGVVEGRNSAEACLCSYNYIREINRLAARECRARKKRLMAELEKTVSNLTSEHSALMKQNRELTIRLETLQRTVGMGLSGAAAMSNFGQNMAQLGLLNQLQQNKKNSGMQQVS